MPSLRDAREATLAVLAGRASLGRVVGCAVVPVGALLAFLVWAAFNDLVPDAISSERSSAWALAALVAVSLIWGPLVIWRASGASSSPVRYTCRLAVIAVAAVIAVGLLMPPVFDHTPEVKLAEAIQWSLPHRTALGIACSEGSLKAGADGARKVRELLGTGDVARRYVRSVTATVSGVDAGRVEVVLEAISDDLRAGQVVIYDGQCQGPTMCWQVSGDIPGAYLERLRRRLARRQSGEC